MGGQLSILRFFVSRGRHDERKTMKKKFRMNIEVDVENDNPDWDVIVRDLEDEVAFEIDSSEGWYKIIVVSIAERD